MPARVIETSLLAGGGVGTITVEGPGRNPSTTDLIAEFYAILHEHTELGSIVFDHDDSVSRQSTGHGCGSLTMTMSDSRLSLFAAGMSEYLLTRQREGLPDGGGEIQIGRLSEDGLGVRWSAWRIPTVTVVQTEHGEAWRIHIHARAISKIQEEVARWPDVETGGVLMGRLSEVSRVAHVVDVVEAPVDSCRSSNEFGSRHRRLATTVTGIFGECRLVALLPRHLAQPSLSRRTICHRSGDGKSHVLGTFDAVNLPDNNPYRVPRTCGRYIVR